jgi:hypothetical protein
MMNFDTSRSATVFVQTVTAAAMALLLALPAPSSAQWVVGVQGGFPGFTVAGQAPLDASYGRQFRLAASAILGYRVGSSVVLRLEPGFVQKGAGVAFDVEGVEDPVDSLSLNLDYLSVPTVMQVFTPGGRGFVTAGVELASLSSATVTTVDGGNEVDVKNELSGSDVAWMFGVGGLVRRSEPQVSLELRYNQSLDKVYEEDAGSPALPQGLRSSGVSLLASISWQLGGDR